HVPERLDDVLGAVALGDELDQPADLVLRPLDALATFLDVGLQVPGVVAQVLRHELADVRDAIRTREALADRIEDPGPRHRLFDRTAVAARSLGTVRGARVVATRRATADGHRAFAVTAGEDPREQVGRTVPGCSVGLALAGVAVPDRLESSLGLLPGR